MNSFPSPSSINPTSVSLPTFAHSTTYFWLQSPCLSDIAIVSSIFALHFPFWQLSRVLRMQSLFVLRAVVVLAVLTQANAVFCACHEPSGLLNFPNSQRCCTNERKPTLPDGNCDLGPLGADIGRFDNCCRAFNTPSRCPRAKIVDDQDGQDVTNK